MTTQAQSFRSQYSDASELMTALEKAGIGADQDWENERTTWTFDDGSTIVVSGSEIEVMSSNELRIKAINSATNHNELSTAVEAYLAEIGESEQARGESYGETAARLGGDDVLERAEARWFELGA